MGTCLQASSPPSAQWSLFHLIEPLQQGQPWLDLHFTVPFCSSCFNQQRDLQSHFVALKQYPLPRDSWNGRGKFLNRFWLIVLSWLPCRERVCMAYNGLNAPSSTTEIFFFRMSSSVSLWSPSIMPHCILVNLFEKRFRLFREASPRKVWGSMWEILFSWRSSILSDFIPSNALMWIAEIIFLINESLVHCARWLKFPASRSWMLFPLRSTALASLGMSLGTCTRSQYVLRNIFFPVELYSFLQRPSPQRVQADSVRSRKAKNRIPEFKKKTTGTQALHFGKKEGVITSLSWNALCLTQGNMLDNRTCFCLLNRRGLVCIINPPLLANNEQLVIQRRQKWENNAKAAQNQAWWAHLKISR